MQEKMIKETVEVLGLEVSPFEFNIVENSNPQQDFFAVYQEQC